MSSAASSYDIIKLQFGITMAAVATLVAFTASATSMAFLILLLIYGALMFASSYVEEEQQFWYWATSGWLAWLSLKK